MNARLCFRDLAIGARFHTGKARGMGARSHVLNFSQHNFPAGYVRATPAERIPPDATR